MYGGSGGINAFPAGLPAGKIRSAKSVRPSGLRDLAGTGQFLQEAERLIHSPHSR